jgi:hypothetical protein
MPKSNKYRKDQQAANVGTRMPIWWKSVYHCPDHHLGTEITKL